MKYAEKPLEINHVIVCLHPNCYNELGFQCASRIARFFCLREYVQLTMATILSV